MAYRSAPLLEDVIWRTHLQPQDPTLAETVRATIAEHREHLLEFIRLDEPAPLSALKSWRNGLLQQPCVPCWLFIPIISTAINH